MNYEEMTKLVADNNKATKFSDQFVICLCWKESNFDPNLKNSKSSATGLMQITKGAVDTVNSNTPKGVHFKHADMTDAATNIQCGTYYLDLCVTKLSGVDSSFGTGPGYSKSIIACEECLKGGKDHTQVCLQKIHK